jgi:hypothetical protein
MVLLLVIGVVAKPSVARPELLPVPPNSSPIWLSAKSLSCKHKDTVSCAPLAGAQCQVVGGGWDLEIDFEEGRAHGGLFDSYTIASKMFNRQGTMDTAYEMLIFLKSASRTSQSQVVSIRFEPRLRALVYLDYMGIGITALNLDCEITAVRER